MSNETQRPMDVGYDHKTVQAAAQTIDCLNQAEVDGAIHLGDGRVKVHDTGTGDLIGWVAHDAEDGWTFLPRISGTSDA